MHYIFKYAICWVILATSFLSPPLSAQASDLLSYYAFEQDLNDRVGTNDLATVGSVSLQNALDNCRRVLSYTGDGHAKKDQPNLGLSTEFMVSFWMKADELMNDQKLLGQADLTGPYRGFVVGVQNNRIKAEVFGVEEDFDISETFNVPLTAWDAGTTITTDWTHVGVTFDIRVTLFRTTG